MNISVELIKNLRNETGAGMMDCKKALATAQGDIARAKEILRAEGKKIFEKKQGRETREGVIGAYVHSNGKLASLIKVYCETDFVARNEEFKKFAHDLAMQVLAGGALYVKPSDVPAAEVAKEKKMILKELAGEKKPAKVLAKIIEGKLRKYKEGISLVCQPFFKNPDCTIQDLVQEKTLQLGEKIEIGEFVKLEL